MKVLSFTVCRTWQKKISKTVASLGALTFDYKERFSLMLIHTAKTPYKEVNKLFNCRFSPNTIITKLGVEHLADHKSHKFYPKLYPEKFYNNIIVTAV